MTSQPRNLNRDTPPAARKTPPLIGLQLRSKQLPSKLDHEIRYDSSIMHRIVPPTLEEQTVLLDASACDIAATFSLPLSLVTTHWFTSRSPMQLPGYHKAIIHKPYNPSPSTHRPQTISTTDLAAYRELTEQLYQKLAIYAYTQQQQDQFQTSSDEDRPRPTNILTHQTRPSRARLERIYEQAALAYSNTSTDNNSNNQSINPTSTSEEDYTSTTQHSTDLSTPSSTKPTNNTICGFLPSTTHVDLLLRHDHKLVTKPSDGLYRRALTAPPLLPASASYTEFLVCRNDGDGGLCLGIAPADTPLARLPLGGYPSELGFHSSGQLISTNGQWTPYGRPYGRGDTIGILVEMPPTCRFSNVFPATTIEAVASPVSSASSSITGNHIIQLQAKVTFFVNGQSQRPVYINVDTSSNATSMHFAACLYRKGCSVQIRCCGSEWEYFPPAQNVCKSLQPACKPRSARTAPPVPPGAKKIGGRGLIGRNGSGLDTNEQDCTSDLTP